MTVVPGHRGGRRPCGPPCCRLRVVACSEGARVYRGSPWKNARRAWASQAPLPWFNGHLVVDEALLARGPRQPRQQGCGARGGPETAMRQCAWRRLISCVERARSDAHIGWGPFWFTLLDAVIWLASYEEGDNALEEVLWRASPPVPGVLTLRQWWAAKGVCSINDASRWLLSRGPDSLRRSQLSLGPDRPLPHSLRLTVLVETGLERSLHRQISLSL